MTSKTSEKWEAHLQTTNHASYSLVHTFQGTHIPQGKKTTNKPKKEAMFTCSHEKKVKVRSFLDQTTAPWARPYPCCRWWSENVAFCWWLLDVKNPCAKGLLILSKTQDLNLTIGQNIPSTHTHRRYVIKEPWKLETSFGCNPCFQKLKIKHVNFPLLFGANNKKNILWNYLALAFHLGRHLVEMWLAIFLVTAQPF